MPKSVARRPHDFSPLSLSLCICWVAIMSTPNGGQGGNETRRGGGEDAPSAREKMNAKWGLAITPSPPRLQMMNRLREVAYLSKASQQMRPEVGPELSGAKCQALSPPSFPSNLASESPFCCVLTPAELPWPGEQSIRGAWRREELTQGSQAFSPPLDSLCDPGRISAPLWAPAQL